jgi:8-oxo-dGTP pyrophosphatase MutT (NUDIX family)
VWDVPGGHVEIGEATIDALERELREELGVDAEITGDPVAALVEGDLRLRVWRVDRWSGEPANRSPDEHDALGWFDIAGASRVALAHPTYLRLIAEALASD